MKVKAALCTKLSSHVLYILDEKYEYNPKHQKIRCSKCYQKFKESIQDIPERIGKSSPFVCTSETWIQGYLIHNVNSQLVDRHNKLCISE